MRRLFSMMSDQVQVTAQQLQTWWATLAPDPRTWVPFTWVLAGIVAVIVLALLIRPRGRAGARRPELLISHGELRVAAWAAPRVVSSLQAPESAAFELAMTVSNLSASPVQLLELAVRTNRAHAPTTAEVAAVLPPHGAVDVTAELREAGGDEGVLDLFVYVPDMPPKTFRVRAKLRWEPWNARYRVLPLDQRVDVARAVGERTQRRRQASAWRRADRRAASVPSAPWPESRSGPPAFSDEGRFEPRPEFVRPRSAPAQDPQGRPEAPRPYEGAQRADAPREGVQRAAAPREGDAAVGRGPADAPRGAGNAGGEETWPPARPAREAHRARVPRPEAGAWAEAGEVEEGHEEGHAEGHAEGYKEGHAADERPEDGAHAREDAEETRAWRLGDAHRAAQRTGMGRAARAARGTERDGPRAVEGEAPPSRQQGEAGAARPSRRWALGSLTPERLPDPGPDELVGPDEGTFGAHGGADDGDARPAAATSSSARQPDARPAPAPRDALRQDGDDAGDDAGDDQGDDAGDDQGDDAGDEQGDDPGDGQGDERGEGEPVERERPRLEFPDEF